MGLQLYKNRTLLLEAFSGEFCKIFLRSDFIAHLEKLLKKTDVC